MERLQRRAIASPTRAHGGRDPVALLRCLAAAVLPPMLVVALGVAAWWLYIRVGDAKPYLVPSPERVWTRWSGDLGFFYGEGWVTVQEALGGLALGAGGALLLAAVLAHSRPVERAVLPVAVALKMTPVVAIAP